MPTIVSKSGYDAGVQVLAVGDMVEVHFDPLILFGSSIQILAPALLSAGPFDFSIGLFITFQYLFVLFGSSIRICTAPLFFAPPLLEGQGRYWIEMDRAINIC